MKTTKDRDGLEVRLCKRGEAYCGTVVGMLDGKDLLCMEPAAIAYRLGGCCRWSYICAGHYGYSKTRRLRKEFGNGDD